MTKKSVRRVNKDLAKKKGMEEIEQDKNCKINGDGSVTITFTEPVFSKVEKKDIPEITIQKLKAKHLYGFSLDNADFEDFMRVASRASGNHESDLGEVSPEDMFRIVMVVSAFF